MVEFFHMSAEQPDWRALRQVAAILHDGGLVVYPTDACYALGCLPQSKDAVERIYTIRQLRRSHDFTLLCAELKVASDFVHMDNAAFKILKQYTPGPYTFILPAQRQVPSYIKELYRDKKEVKTMGIRIPNHPLLSGLLDLLEQPLLTSTLQLPDSENPLNAEDLFAENLHIPVDAVIEAGQCSERGTTIIDLTASPPLLVREGIGAWG
jgi:tRNA threonylcarbamoyl adenosine modification protein (Sua5/YciO/YrdC/YwlC family)